MTQRDKNRRREHEPHGWYASDRALKEISGEVFVDCPCGWFGWVSETAVNSM